MSSGELRRSVRILVLEAKRAQQAVNTKKHDMNLDSIEGQSSCRQRRKKSKVDHASSKNATNPVPTAVGWSETPLPRTGALKLLLDMLKRRDTCKIFAEPVKVAEVRGYAHVVKEPMDFLTISSKLDKGKYMWLEQFEHDVFLVFSNAMLFNPSNTIYYRQAHAIREVAQKLFAALRADAIKFEIELAQAKIVNDGWTKAEARLVNSLASNQSKTSMTTGEKAIGNAGAMNSEGVLQPQKTYNPWAFYFGKYEAPISAAFSGPDSTKTIALINQSWLFHGRNAGLENNMLNLSGGWGQVAQVVAQPEFSEYDHGTFSHWYLPSPKEHQVPNPQQVPDTAYPGNGLLPSIQANPFGNLPPVVSGQNVQALQIHQQPVEGIHWCSMA